jgi:hypothetical protein
MRRSLTGALTSALAAAGLAAAVQGVAFAGADCQVTDPETGTCLISAEAPETDSDSSDDGPKRTGRSAPCVWDGTAQGISDPEPGPVPCTDEGRYWSNSHRCYISPLDPQPPAGDPAWQGRGPGDGAVYSCDQPQAGLLTLIWSADAPLNSGAGPTPGGVAQLAIEQMDLQAIDIGITPEPGSDSIGLVGMPVWMWVANPNSHTVGPISASASAGGITVTATARAQKITWDMGDGSSVPCTVPGTPYKASYGNRKSPDCGHVYQLSSARQSGAKYTVQAVSDWVVTWQGAGQTGTIRLNGLTRTTEIAVGEAQVLVQ